MTSVSSVIVSICLLQTLNQQRIVHNYYNHWQVLVRLEQDLTRYLDAEPMLTSHIVVKAQEIILIDKLEPKHRLTVTIDLSQRITTWNFDA